MKKLALALAATAALAGQAFAADMPMKAARPIAAPVPVANWTGCYIAGGFGYGLYDNETNSRFVNGAGTVTVTGADVDVGGRGWLAGGGGGCDYQFGLGGGGGFFGTGQFVIGILGDYYWANMRGNRPTVFGNSQFSGQEKVDSQWAIGGRIGWLMSPNLLTYFSGGYTEAHLTGVGNFFTPINNTFTGTYLPGRTAQGWFLGSGVEYQSGWIPNLTWKTEYRFSEYNRVDRPERVIATGLPTGSFSQDKLFVQTVMTSWSTASTSAVLRSSRSTDLSRT